MFLFSTLKSITTTIVQPFVYVAEVIAKAVTAVVSKIIPKRTRIHEMNLVAFTEYIESESNSTSKNTSTSNADIESIFKITQCKSHDTSSLSFAFPPYKIKPGTLDIETGFFGVIEEEDEDEEVKNEEFTEPKSIIQVDPKVVASFPILIRSVSPPHSPLPSPPPSFPLPPLPTTVIVSHPIHRYQQKCRLDPSKEMIKTCARNIRIGRARAQRQSLLFGNNQTPGLISPKDLLQQTKNNTSSPLTQIAAPNIFAQSEAAQKRILHARALRHKALFGIDIDIPDSGSDYSGSGAPFVSDSGLGSGENNNSEDNPEEFISLQDIPTPAPSIDSAFEYELEFKDQNQEYSQVITIEDNDNGSSEDSDNLNDNDGDFSFVTAESTDSEAYTPYYTTPTRTPTRRARVIVSGNYGGGSINYSHRISRNSDDMDILLDQMKKVYEVRGDLTAVYALEESSIGF